MQVSVVFPDLDLPKVVVAVTSHTTVDEVLRSACEEWAIEDEYVELLVAGELLPPSGKVITHLIESDVELVATQKRVRLFGKDTLSDRSAVLKQYEEDKCLYLDTRTFTINDVLTIGGPQTPLPSLAFVESVSLRCAAATTSVGDSFRLNQSLTSLDMSELYNITSIGDQFLHRCSSLQVLTLSGCLRKVTTIGNEFLLGCSLRTVDLSGLRNLTTIGNNFMTENSGLVELDLSNLNKVTTIGHDFLSYCRRLSEVQLSGLVNVTSIGCNFLENCVSLFDLDLSGLQSLHTLGGGFLVKCLLMEISLPACNRPFLIRNSKVVRGLVKAGCEVP